MLGSVLAAADGVEDIEIAVLATFLNRIQERILSNSIVEKLSASQRADEAS
jgi:hypothetical protein